MNYNQVYKILRAYKYRKPEAEYFLNRAHDGIAQTVRLDRDDYFLTWNADDGFNLNPVQKIEEP